MFVADSFYCTALVKSFRSPLHPIMTASVNACKRTAGAFGRMEVARATTCREWWCQPCELLFSEDTFFSANQITLICQLFCVHPLTAVFPRHLVKLSHNYKQFSLWPPPSISIHWHCFVTEHVVSTFVLTFLYYFLLSNTFTSSHKDDRWSLFWIQTLNSHDR